MVGKPRDIIENLRSFPLLTTKEGEKDQAGGKKLSIVVGPWGGNGGNYWDDGSYSGVREITLAYDRCIDSIRVVYDKNGKPVAAEQHGGVGGTRTAEIKLQYPEEGHLESKKGPHFLFQWMEA
ncbi:unnamed protein product [Camellia sinensis]